MKTRILSLVFLFAAPAVIAQTEVVEYQYKNNTFSVAEQDKQLARSSTGKIFYTRIKAFDSFNKRQLKPFISREQFVFIGSMFT